MKALNILSFATLALLAGCIDDHLPDKLDSFDKDSAFTTLLYRPTLGRTTVFTDNFNTGNSTVPLTFTLTNVRHADGSPAPELTDPFPVRVWKSPYLGTEKTLAEIEGKRTYENRPLLQVRQHSGEVVMWGNALSSFVECSPADGYLFDVKVENSGGYKYYTDLQLIPERELEYEPNPADQETGFIKDDFIHPTLVSNMAAEGGSGFFSLMTVDDVEVYFHRDVDNTDKENTLTFRFMTKDFRPIDPRKFNQTKWDELIHGFDMEMTDEYVRYKVAYPIPLSPLPNKYTTQNGEQAHVLFSYDRIGRSGRRVTTNMTLDFAIFKEGHWEIMFVFAGATPEFRDNV